VSEKVRDRGTRRCLDPDAAEVSDRVAIKAHDQGAGKCRIAERSVTESQRRG